MADWAADIEQACVIFTRYFKDRDFKAMSEMYTDDATLMPPGEKPQKGKKAAMNLFSTLSELGAARLVNTTEEIIPNVDTATDRGNYVLYRADGSVFDEGKSLVVWKRVGGQIKYYIDMWSSNISS